VGNVRCVRVLVWIPSKGSSGREIGVGTNRARTAKSSKRKNDATTFSWVAASDKELGTRTQRKCQWTETWAGKEGILDPARGMYLHFLHLE
jgi:hypothetical protein